jgi:tripartite-type tricarboxylate transporter receptor subunit TctC
LLRAPIIYNNAIQEDVMARWFTFIVFAMLVIAPLAPPEAQAQAQTQAQTWPQRTVKLILPFGAGTATDVAARLLGDRLATRWGKPVVVENRPGGDGLVAISAFVTAADDHVLLYASSASFIAHPYLHEKLPYNLERDLQPIARISHTVLAASVPAATEFKTVRDFVEGARKAPDKYNVAGAAGLPEFAVEAFVKAQNLKVAKVPYRDVVQAARDLGENRIQFLLSSYTVVRSLVEAGKVRLVAVGGRQRSKVAPDVPAMAETGFPELVIETTAGFYGPAGMPLELRKRIGMDIIAVANEPSVSERIAATGQDMVPAGPDELLQTIKQQAAAAEAIAKILGLKRKN